MDRRSPTGCPGGVPTRARAGRVLTPSVLLAVVVLVPSGPAGRTIISGEEGRPTAECFRGRPPIGEFRLWPPGRPAVHLAAART